MTHAVCVGMTGSGKTGLCIALLEEAAIDGVPAIVIDPKGDLANLLLTFPDLRPRISCRGSTRTTPGARDCRPTGYAATAGRALEEGPRRVGPGRRAHPPLQGRGRLRRLHAGQRGRARRLDPQVVRRAAAGGPRRRRAPARAREQHGDQLARPARHRRRSDPEPRAHPALDPARHRLAATGATSTWPRSIQEIQTPPMARIGVLDLESFYPAKERFELAMRREQPARLAGLRRVAGGRAARHRRGCCTTPDGQAAHRDLLDRAPRRRRAHVLRLAAAEPDAGWMRSAVRHDEPARDPLHGRDLRLLPAGGEPAVEAAAAHAAEAGARVRRRRGARDAEPRRPRLQGARERGHVVHRPAADRARQGARARGLEGVAAGEGTRFDRGRDGAAPRRPRQPRLPDEQRARGRARGVRDALGDVVSPRPAHARLRSRR